MTVMIEIKIRKKPVTIFLCCLLTLIFSPGLKNQAAAGYLPVFPGAMGHGTETKAGRGGKVIKVTNLNDSGTGSLRAALEASGARIIVFEVSGTIKLSKNILITKPYITVAGQTAPSPGILLRGAGLCIMTTDVLVQHIRIRVGDASSGPNPVNRDALQILGTKAKNVVVDHVSLSWGVDENFSTWYSLSNVTISNCIVSEALDDSIHPKGPHSGGALLGDGSKNLTFINNLLAHDVDRNPRVKGNVSAQIVNNYFYNCGTVNFSDVGSSSGANLLSYVGNAFIRGADTPTNGNGIKVSGSTVSGSKIYFKDNIASGTVYSATKYQVSSPPVWHSSINAIASSKVKSYVTTRAGARPADRDAVDKRIVNEVLNNGGHVIDTPGQVGGWPSLKTNTRIFVVPSNPNGDSDGDGYTNIEEVLHQMAKQVQGS
jgi:hypothetical protein